MYIETKNYRLHFSSSINRRFALQNFEIFKGCIDLGVFAHINYRLNYQNL